LKCIDSFATAQGPYFEYINDKLYIRKEYTVEAFKKNYKPGLRDLLWWIFGQGIIYPLYFWQLSGNIWIVNVINWVVGCIYALGLQNEVALKMMIKRAHKIRAQEIPESEDTPPPEENEDKAQDQTFSV